MSDPKCEDRIQAELESRLDDLHTLWDAYTNNDQDCPRCEREECPACEGEGEDQDGNKCPQCKGEGEIYVYEDDGGCPICGGSGHVDEDGNTQDLGNIYEYGLSFDYVAPQTFRDQDEGYFRYQLSYGGPSDEFRVFAHPTPRGFSVYRIEYWFLDWFDGARRTLSGEDRQFIQEIFDSLFVESETAKFQYDQAMENWEPSYEEEED